MILINKTATLFQAARRDLQKTTHLCVAAHPDDIELMAYSAISTCYDQPNLGFTGVTVTNGAGSIRNGTFADFTDEQMVAVRRNEQNLAAERGLYLAQFQLDYPSKAIKSSAGVVDDLAAILKVCQPEIVYMHNLADRHPTHIEVALRTIEALRQLPAAFRPRQVIGVEVWRSLDWMPDSRKIILDTSKRPDLAKELLTVFASQNQGGKRYDLAALDRRRANATFLSSHATEDISSLSIGLDQTELIDNPNLSPSDWVNQIILEFALEARNLLI